MQSEIGLNEKLPNFRLEATILNACTEKDLLGSLNVLYIYPKDNTSGCTRQTKEFNESYSSFKSLGINIFGLSKDTIASHEKFSEKLNLQFPLISDPNTDLIKSLGAWKEKSMYGKKYMGAERSTFLIDKNLIIKHLWRKVKVNGHVEHVFEKCQELSLSL